MMNEQDRIVHEAVHEQHDAFSDERWKAHADKHADEKELDSAYREAHAQLHSSVARNLDEYKTASNEWRAALADMRSSFATKGEVEALGSRIANEREERRDVQNLRTGARQGLSQTAAIFLGIIAVGGTLVGITATILAVFKP